MAFHPLLKRAPLHVAGNLMTVEIYKRFVNYTTAFFEKLSRCYLILLILLGHQLLLRLSLALVAMILKPNFHLK